MKFRAKKKNCATSEYDIKRSPELIEPNGESGEAAELAHIFCLSSLNSNTNCVYGLYASSSQYSELCSSMGECTLRCAASHNSMSDDGRASYLLLFCALKTTEACNT